MPGLVQALWWRRGDIARATIRPTGYSLMNRCTHSPPSCWTRAAVGDTRPVMVAHGSATARPWSFVVVVKTKGASSDAASTVHALNDA